jgi:hypothetical protein
VIVEKMDRLCRNLPDFVLVESLVEELGLEVHLVKDGQVLRKESKSQDRLVQGMFALLARNYIQNMQEEIQKGQLVKAEKGQYPGRAMFGYAHDRETRTIVAHPTRTGVVKLIFELYSTGQYSADTLRKEIIKQTGEKISKSRLHEMLKSRFYLGLFTWRGREYKGIHPPLVDPITFERVQDIIAGRNRNKLKPRKQVFPFSGLLKCADDGCAITAERHKGKYVYYRCTYGRGKHKFPLVREEKLADMLGTVLKGIEIPAEVAQTILQSIRADQGGIAAERQEESNRLNEQLSTLDNRKRMVYKDKLCGVIDEEFCSAMLSDLSFERTQAQEALKRVSMPILANQSLSVKDTLELAETAHSIYFKQDFAKRAEMLKTVLSNCSTDGLSLYPTYTKPFDLIHERAKNEEWRGRRGSNPRPLPS